MIYAQDQCDNLSLVRQLFEFRVTVYIEKIPLTIWSSILRPSSCLKTSSDPTSVCYISHSSLSMSAFWAVPKDRVTNILLSDKESCDQPQWVNCCFIFRRSKDQIFVQGPSVVRFLWFDQVRQTDARIEPQSRPQSLPSSSSPVPYSQTTSHSTVYT
jgi:hypothetical protein